jgi:hypothetical protein
MSGASAGTVLDIMMGRDGTMGWDHGMDGSRWDHGKGRDGAMGWDASERDETRCGWRGVACVRVWMKQFSKVASDENGRGRGGRPSRFRFRSRVGG